MASSKYLFATSARVLFVLGFYATIKADISQAKSINRFQMSVHVQIPWNFNLWMDYGSVKTTDVQILLRPLNRSKSINFLFNLLRETLTHGRTITEFITNTQKPILIHIMLSGGSSLHTSAGCFLHLILMWWRRGRALTWVTCELTRCSCGRRSEWPKIEYSLKWLSRTSI